jgi:hypothetical protein
MGQEKLMSKTLGLSKFRVGLVLLSAVFGFLFAFFIYLQGIQSPILAKREIAFTALLWLTLTFLVYFLLSRFLLPQFRKFSPRVQLYWLASAILIGLFSAIAIIPSREVYLLLPSRTLEVSIPAGKADRVITIQALTTEFGDISFSQFSLDGNWRRIGNSLTYSGSSPVTLRWVGRTGSSATLVFAETPAISEVVLGWDGQLNPLDTTQTFDGQIIYSLNFPAGWTGNLVSRLLTGFLIGFMVLAFGLFLTLEDPESRKSVNRKKGAWLLYALPMIGVWVLFLLIFFPGLINQDSILQWQQVLTGQYTDHHPLLYTLLIAFVSRIYYSPASVVISQIVMVSFALAWGFGELDHMGVPRKVLWGLSVLCALLPVNILTAITLRKDVLYSAALLVLSIIFLKIINSRGDWIKHPWNWLTLGINLAVIALTRINGYPVAIGSLLLILIIYRRAWRQIFGAAGIFILLLVVMYGPIYSFLNVKREPEFGTLLPFHHIAAHLQAGTSLSPNEKEYLSNLAPLDGWNYDCCLVNSTTKAIFPGFAEQNFDLPLLKQDIRKPTQIALSLFLKDPLVDLRHMVCAGQQVYSLKSSCPDRIVVSLNDLLESSDPRKLFFLTENLMGFTSDSKLPEFIIYAHPYLQVFSEGLLHKLNYTTAIYLYISIFCTVLLAVRKKQWRITLFLIPVLVQSVTLLLINISQTYRYQYGAILVGLLSLGFINISTWSNKLSGSENSESFENLGDK